MTIQSVFRVKEGPKEGGEVPLPTEHLTLIPSHSPLFIDTAEVNNVTSLPSPVEGFGEVSLYNV